MSEKTNIPEEIWELVPKGKHHDPHIERVYVDHENLLIRKITLVTEYKDGSLDIEDLLNDIETVYRHRFNVNSLLKEL